ncbi:MAG: histidine kinase dimerization/phosphoacceptor domain -containing protein [Saprospiraceae bacterium]
MKNQIFLLITFLLFSTNSNGQIKEDTTLLKSLNSIGLQYLKDNNYIKADSMFCEVIKYSGTENYASLAEAYQNRASVYQEREDVVLFDSLLVIGLNYARLSKDNKIIMGLLNTKLISHAIQKEYNIAYKIGLELLQTIPKETRLIFYGKVSYNMGNLSNLIGNYENAINHYITADSVFTILGDSKASLSVLSGIALVYKTLKDHQNAKKYYLKVINQSELHLNSLVLANAYYNYGAMNASNGLETNTMNIELIDSANVVYNRIGNKLGVLRTYSVYARLYNNIGDKKKSLSYINKVIEYNKKAKRPIGAFNSYYLKGKLLLESNKPKEAINFFNKAKTTKNVTDLELQNLNYYYSKALRGIGKHKKSYEILLNSYSIKDTIYKNINIAEIKKIESVYQLEKQESVNDKLIAQQKLEKIKLKSQKLLTTLGGIGILLLSSLLFIIFKQRNKQKDLNKTLADRNVKISLISREIAHRSKNQLALATNLISNQKYKVEDIGAKQLIEESENKLKALSAVNRRLSDDDELSRVSLKEVIEEVVSNNIYSLSNIDIKYDLSLPNNKIDSSKMSLIALIINELTTNSIKHAFEGNSNPKISVEATIVNDKFSMKYTDNGHVVKQKKAKGTGQNLISGLVNQLQGIYKINVTSGFNFELNMPL